MTELELAIDAVRKKLVGKSLSYGEIFAVMDQISKRKFGDVLTTYFAASGYAKGFSNQELYYLTKAMVETGEALKFDGIVADKHSIGGVPGTRTTLIVVPIVAAAGFTIPKSSSRAITTPDGTADDMEVLAPVTFTKAQIYKIVEKTKACIVWGGSVDIAPADDVLINVEKPLMFESFDKIVVSIMAKKIAFGSNHVVIDIPYGDSVKVHTKKDAEAIAQKFIFVAEKFSIKIHCHIHRVEEPEGNGIGPILECREALRVLEQAQDRPLDLEEKALDLAGLLLDLCLKDLPKNKKDEIVQTYKDGRNWAKLILRSGQALTKMKKIIEAQGGNPDISSNNLKPGKFALKVVSHKPYTVDKINSKNATIIAKILGAPKDKHAGIFLEKKIGEKVERDEALYTLYANKKYHLDEAEYSLAHFPIYTFL